VEALAAGLTVMHALTDTTYWTPVDCFSTATKIYQETACESRCYRALATIATPAETDDPFSTISTLGVAPTTTGVAAPVAASTFVGQTDATAAEPGTDGRFRFENYDAQAATTTGADAQTKNKWARADCDDMPTVYFDPAHDMFSRVTLKASTDQHTTFDSNRQSWKVLDTAPYQAPAPYQYPARAFHLGAVVAAGTLGVFDTNTAYDQSIAEATADTFAAYQGSCYQFIGQYLQNVKKVALAAAGVGQTLSSFQYNEDPSVSDWLKVPCDGSFAEADWAAATDALPTAAALANNAPASVLQSKVSMMRGEIDATNKYSVATEYLTDQVVWWNGRCWRAKQTVPAGNNYPGGASPTRWGKARDPLSATATVTATDDYWQQDARCVGVTATRRTWGTFDYLSSRDVTKGTFDFDKFPYLTTGPTGPTHTGNVLSVASPEYVAGGTVQQPNQYYDRPFAGADTGTAYTFRPNNKGKYTLEVTMMGTCGASTDTVDVMARCLPLEPKPVFFVDTVLGTNGRGTNNGNTNPNERAHRGRDLTIGFTPETLDLTVGTAWSVDPRVVAR
jgi:hypothetical protein